MCVCVPPPASGLALVGGASDPEPEPGLTRPRWLWLHPVSVSVSLTPPPSCWALGECVDIVGTLRPDEKAIMTYVSCFYHAFSGAQKVSSPRFGLSLTRLCSCTNTRQVPIGLQEGHTHPRLPIPLCFSIYYSIYYWFYRLI